MKSHQPALLVTSMLVAVASFTFAVAAQTPPADPGWPRVFKKDGQQLTVYQPQVDYWNGYTNLHFRCAIGVKGVSKQEKFGVAEVDALTVTDHGARVVAMVPLNRELRFANVPKPELTKLRQAVEQLRPSGQVTTLALDRLLAYPPAEEAEAADRPAAAAITAEEGEGEVPGQRLLHPGPKIEFRFSHGIDNGELIHREQRDALQAEFCSPQAGRARLSPARRGARPTT
jgi:hypothetical protein